MVITRRDEKARLKEQQSTYRLHAPAVDGLPIFAEPWWLDAAAGPDGWSACNVIENGTPLALMPYSIRRRFRLRIVGQPPLTPALGPLLAPISGPNFKRLSLEKELMGNLIAQLPPFDLFRQTWSPSIINWMPFYWAGFEQTTRYTYQLKEIRNEAALWQGMKGSVRSDIKKAVSRFGLSVIQSDDIEEFTRLHTQVFARQGLHSPHAPDLLRRLDHACRIRNRRTIFMAQDQTGATYAGVYVVWDRKAAYYLLGGSVPHLRHTGAVSLCLWEAVRAMSDVAPVFDFEGSMIEGIERSFRAFGGDQVPYMSVRKVTSRTARSLMSWGSQ